MLGLSALVAHRRKATPVRRSLRTPRTPVWQTEIPRSRIVRKRSSPSLNEERLATLPGRNEDPLSYGEDSVIRAVPGEPRSPGTPHEADPPPDVATLESAGIFSPVPVEELFASIGGAGVGLPCSANLLLLGQEDERMDYVSEHPPPPDGERVASVTAGGSGVDALFLEKYDAETVGEGSNTLCTTDVSLDGVLLKELRINLERVGETWERSPRRVELQDRAIGTSPTKDIDWRQYRDDALRVEERVLRAQNMLLEVLIKADKAKRKTKRTLNAIRAASAEATRKLEVMRVAAEEVARIGANIAERRKQRELADEKRKALLAAARKRSAPPPPPPRALFVYDAEASWEDFLRVYEENAKVSGWSAVQKASYLSRYLPTEALSMIYHISPTATAAYERMIEVLRQRYGYGGKTSVNQALLKARRQEPGETSIAYAAALSNLAQRAYPSVSEELRDEVIWNLFLAGLADRGVAGRARAMATTPTTMQQVLDKVLVLEEANVRHRPKPAVRSPLKPRLQEPIVRPTRSAAHVEKHRTTLAENAQGSGMAIRPPPGPPAMLRH